MLSPAQREAIVETTAQHGGGFPSIEHHPPCQ
jgi:hypothetical protein